jgi:hypothetical protein
MISPRTVNFMKYAMIMASGLVMIIAAIVGLLVFLKW